MLSKDREQDDNLMPAAPARGLRTVEIDDELLDDIRELIRDEAKISLLNILADLHPADIADLVENVELDDQRYLMGLLSHAVAAEVVAELGVTARAQVLEFLSHETLTSIVAELESDDAADLVADLPGPVADKILGTIRAEEAASVESLLRYAEDTAGGIMGTEVLTVFGTDTVKTAVRKAREFATRGLDLDVLYVVDHENVLLGCLPVGNLIIEGPGRRMSRVMQPAVSVKADMDQEEVANIIEKYDLVSVPVVDGDNHILGRITVDDVVDVIKEEAKEDIERMAGLSGTEESSSSVLATSRIRLPWLILGFLGQILSALVLKKFEAPLSEIIASAFFIPIIMAMGGNAGIQSSTIVVRALALGEIGSAHIGRRLLKESGVGVINGVILSLFLFAFSYYWLDDFRFGYTVSLALFAVVINATLIGSMVPLVLNTFKIDPAMAMGPFITTANDAIGLLIYFGFISLLYI